MKLFLVLASISVFATACGQKLATSQVKEETAAALPSQFSQGDKIICVDDGSIHQTLTIKITQTSPIKAYARIEGERSKFYPAASVNAYMDIGNLVFEMNLEDGSYDYVEVPDTLTSQSSRALRADQDDSWAIQCKLQKNL